MEDFFSTSDEVSAALAGGNPVVALETAVLTHGLPRPQNLALFREILAGVREGGAVPAVVGLLDGKLRVGLTDEEVDRLGEEEGVQKVGMPDLPLFSARRQSGGTTVAATLWAARGAGVPVFATGGIGGVHRGAADSFDISGDLPALSRFGGCVVCSGAKAILDLPKTFEALESLGVPVLAYGVDEIPAFTCRESGIRAKARVDSPEEIARVLLCRDSLGLPASVVVANPVPSREAIPRAALETSVSLALGEARRGGVTGKDLTPFVLRALALSTEGASVRANRALLLRNAELAARIAVARSRLGERLLGRDCDFP